MQQNILEFSKSIKSQAQVLLEASEVIPIFSQIGKVELTGSYFLDAMYRKDIDLLVTSEKPSRADASEVTRSLVEKGFFSDVCFFDNVNFFDPTYARSYLWELMYPSEEGSWKFDIWYTLPSSDYALEVLRARDHFENCLEKNPACRQIILKLKEEFYDGIKYRDSIRGLDIYTAVCDFGVADTDEFLDWFKNKA